MQLIGVLSFMLLFVCWVYQSSATDYCSASLCRGAHHIACNNNGAYGSACASNAKIVPISKKLKTVILKKHNSLRNLIARGGLKRYKPAARMATMRWNNELSNLAALNVKQCQMKHDACRATDRFPYAGQNLAYSSWTGDGKSVQKTLAEHIQLWFKENKYASMSVINSFQSPTSGNQIGHFTQLVQQNATHVGCAVLRQKKGRFYYQFTACNYAITNIVGKPVYESSSSGGSGCTTSKNPTYESLCSVNEPYNVKLNK